MFTSLLSKYKFNSQIIFRTNLYALDVLYAISFIEKKVKSHDRTDLYIMYFLYKEFSIRLPLRGFLTFRKQRLIICFFFIVSRSSHFKHLLTLSLVLSL